MPQERHVGVLLLQMGGPLELNQIKPYVERLFLDPYLIQLPRPISWFRRPLARWIASRRAPKLFKQYTQMGGPSPNNSTTIRQAEALQAALSKQDRITFHCFAAMTYTAPRIGEAIAAAKNRGCTELIALSLFPQFCGATTGSSFNEVQDAARASGIADPCIRWVRNWGTHPLFIKAACDDLRTEIRTASTDHADPPHLIFSAHGIPESYIQKGDPYVNEVHDSVQAIVSHLDRDLEHTLCFQSRATPSRWVGPSTIDTVQSLAAAGKKNLIVHPVSFVNDHLETLYEIDIELAEIARQSGVERFARVPTFNDDARLTEILKDLVTQEDRQ